MKKKIIAAGLLFLCCLRLCAQTVTVSGYVKDAASGAALQGVNIYAKSYRYGQTTDATGYFNLRLPAHKQVELTFSYVGYTKQVYSLAAERDTSLVVAMIQDNRLPDVHVYAPRRDFGVNNSQMSAIELPVAQVNALPALFGEVDVMKALQRLPGVQSAADGNAGIFVRGGNYDQNLITLDGSTLYNSEHLKGFVSALNADMIENIILYKGAFPARYGARLSSVVDIGMKEGDFEHHHGSLNIGMLSSRIHLEGPIRKGTTSFNLGARLSYFDAIVQPLLEEVYDKPSALQPYSNMNYYDVNAKVVHKFSEQDKLSAVFYWGKDVSDSSPTESHQQYSMASKTESGKEELTNFYDNQKSNSTNNTWGNIVSSLFWTHVTNKQLRVNTNLSYSRYNYQLKMTSKIHNQQHVKDRDENLRLEYEYKEDSYAQYHSGIDDAALTVDFRYAPNAQHQLRWGAKASLQQLTPTVDVYKRAKTIRWGVDGYHEKEQLVDTILGEKQKLRTAALYIEDDWELTKRWKMNVGLRYTLFAVKAKTYHSIEPRVSLRYLLTDDMALKASYSHMAQGIHLLSSSNLVMPSDIWVSITKDVPLMKADQWALGFNYTVSKGIDFSVEGYYKEMDNVIDYREGVSYMTSSGDWQEMIALGKGRAYGVELFLQKKTGKTTGWIGYTWSKSLRTYNRLGQEISGGKEFYAGNDRRNNLNLVLSHRFNKRWEVSAAWTYQTGRRGILSTTAIYGGKVDEYDPYGVPTSADSYKHGDGYGDIPDGATYFRKFSRFYTYSERNGYKLPDIHRLDVGVNYSVKHQRGESVIGLSIYNLYNQQNVSNVYIGYDKNKTVLKGVCMFPFMPSLNYTLKF
ncbi:TonB-dependent receptor [Bacteroides sp. 214]|uniref:TonB-dependent receptor n=1 Tax=Bacteroides sp. 214 TaxID=2302935 RepID=UPI0013CF5528|nr:TonB-dependent receptor [Bacteroides sp. 214]NDW12909.1 TonB-dependent receptor [Bacteroides sp. 214]